VLFKQLPKPPLKICYIVLEENPLSYRAALQQVYVRWVDTTDLICGGRASIQ